MADATLYCKTCDERTGHMHLASRTCICSVCGEKTDAPNWREIAAEVEARKKANQAAVASRNGKIETNTAPADTAAPDTETTKTKGETNMPKGNKLTDQDKADIVRLRGEGKKVSEIAKDFHVSEMSVYYTLSKTKAGKPAKTAGKPTKAPKAARASRTSKAAPKQQEQTAAAPCQGFDEAGLTTLVKDAVHIQVSAYLADLDRRLTLKVRDALREAFR